MVLNISVPQI